MKIDSKYLPSKRFTYSVIIMILLIAVAFAISFSRNKIAEYKIAQIQEKNSQEANIRQQFLQADTDSDGLKDWEEALWQTDPKNPDTDADGTKDGDEVKVNRDPIKAGPNDKIDPKIIEEEKRITEEYNNLNATEKLSRDLFSQYIASRNVSTEMSESDVSNLVQTTLSLQNTPSSKTYSTKDLNITTETTKDSIKKWINGLISTSTNSDLEENELVILDRALTEESPAELKKLTKIASRYKEMAEGLLKISVPENITETHLKMANSLNTIAESLYKLSVFFDDPVGSFQYIGVYLTGVETLYSALYDIKEIANVMKIEFKETDNGYWLINMI